MRPTKTLSGVWITILVGCTTPGKPEYKASEIIERQQGADETPKWVDSETSIGEANGEVIFTSQLSLSGNSRNEACFQGAELSARSSILRHIKESLTASGQLNEASAASDPGIESLTAFLSQGNLSGVKTTRKYWEKREESDADTGDRVLKLHCAVQVAIRKSDLQRQLQAALGSGGNQQVRDKLIEAQKQFLESVGSADADKVAH